MTETLRTQTYDLQLQISWLNHYTVMPGVLLVGLWKHSIGFYTPAVPREKFDDAAAAAAAAADDDDDDDDDDCQVVVDRLQCSANYFFVSRISVRHFLS